MTLLSKVVIFKVPAIVKRIVLFCKLATEKPGYWSSHKSLQQRKAQNAKRKDIFHFALCILRLSIPWQKNLRCSVVPKSDFA